MFHKSITSCRKSPEDKTKKKNIIEEVKPVKKIPEVCEQHDKEQIKKKDTGGREEKRRRSMYMMWGSWEMVEGVEGLGVVARRCSSLTEEEEVEVEEVREVYRDSMRIMQSVVNSQEKMVTTLIHRLQCVNHETNNCFH